MNSTLFITSVTFINNSLTTIVESWFIPLNILSIICTIFVIGFATFFLFILVFDKTCHTVPMMLVANSCLAELLLAINGLWIAVFTLQNDFKQIQYHDSFCVFRGYISFSSYALQNCSYLLQSIYRYVIVVYPNRLFWQTARTQLFFIVFSWIFAFVYPIVFLFTNEIIYNVDNQICQVSLRLSFSVIYTAQCLYIIPVLSIIFVYFLLIRYVKGMNKRVIPVNTLFRAQRELKMVRRIVILVMILFIAGFPYALFVFISLFTSPPKYHFRIAYAFINLLLPFAMISLFQFTDTLKASVKKILNYRPNTIIPALT
ncbi:unnamed protein product [Rotaria sordida]|uniref:G-protein coupled receptors family 1 profile domain-containing protein n=1 Tax=Rotaria sordida TaxID=392033 RepID=A0A813VC38_9BILA|nr:unnamed protein product [Rotaria sordida]CAF4002728.1 unnamed protein product [Rotaria sordida]